MALTTFNLYGLIMIGLKTFIPDLANVLGVSDLALYERQRVLVRDGLLANTKGRGPGSGVRFTSETVATLLIAILATPSLKVTSAETSMWLYAKRDRRDAEKFRKPQFDLGGAETFKEALANALTSNEKISIVQVHRADSFAAFIFEDRRLTFTSKKKPNSSAFNEIGQIYVPPIRALVRNTLEVGATDQEIAEGRGNRK